MITINLYKAVYRECNITDWHTKYFFTLKAAEKFIRRLRSLHWEDRELYKASVQWDIVDSPGTTRS